MKRKLALLLVLALCLTGGCTYAPHTILTVNAGSVSRIVLTRMEDSRELELVRDAEIRPLVELLASVSVRYCGDCDGTEEHVYRLEVYVGDTQAGEICLNQDGSFCRSGKHRVPEKEEEGRQVLEACRVLLETAPEENALEEGCWEPVREPAETSVPLPAPSVIRWLSAQSLTEAPDSWRYIQAVAELGGERYSVFAREQTGRRTEIIYGFSQHNAGGYTLVYEEDSFENSAGAWLCFSLVGPEPEEGAEREQIPCFYDVERELFRMGMPAQMQE